MPDILEQLRIQVLKSNLGNRITFDSGTDIPKGIIFCISDHSDPRSEYEEEMIRQTEKLMIILGVDPDTRIILEKGINGRNSYQNGAEGWSGWIPGQQIYPKMHVDNARHLELKVLLLHFVNKTSNRSLTIEEFDYLRRNINQIRYTTTTIIYVQCTN